MTDLPLVSIIVPVYNRANHVTLTLDSLLTQTYPNLEIILVDDGSTDNSAEVISPYLSEQVLYVKQDNAGAPAARNHGFSISKGDFIVFFDSDDLMLPGRIEAQVKALIQQNAACCAAGYYINEVGGASYLPPAGDADQIAQFVNLELLGSTQSWMFSRKLITDVNGFDPVLTCRQDADLTFRVLQRVPKVAMLKEKLSLFMDHEGEERIMNNWNAPKHLHSKTRYHAKVLAHLSASHRADLMPKAIDRFYWDVAPAYAKGKDYKNIWKLYKMGLDNTRSFKGWTKIQLRIAAVKSLLYWTASGLKA